MRLTPVQSSTPILEVSLNEIEASIFFGIAVLPWALCLPVIFRIPFLFWLLLSPFAYWLFQSGLQDFGAASLILVIPGWSAGVELLLVDYIGFSVVDLLKIERCPCRDDISWWRPVLWILFAGLIAGPALALSEIGKKKL